MKDDLALGRNYVSISLAGGSPGTGNFQQIISSYRHFVGNGLRRPAQIDCHILNGCLRYFFRVYLLSCQP